MLKFYNKVRNPIETSYKNIKSFLPFISLIKFASILEKFLDYDLVVYPLPKAINFLKALAFRKLIFMIALYPLLWLQKITATVHFVRGEACGASSQYSRK